MKYYQNTIFHGEKMSYILNRINKNKIEILNDENIESYVWRYILKHKFFTENKVMMDYLEEKYRIPPQLFYKYDKIIRRYRSITQDLQSKIKSTLENLETINLVKRTIYTDKIYIVV